MKALGTGLTRYPKQKCHLCPRSAKLEDFPRLGLRQGLEALPFSLTHDWNQDSQERGDYSEHNYRFDECEATNLFPACEHSNREIGRPLRDE